MDSNDVERMESSNQEPLEPRRGTSVIRTCFNGLNALSGVGILSIPYALSQGGWLCLIVLFLIATICFYTGLLLKRCMDVDPLIKTYPDIGRIAFGSKGRAIISTFMYIELFLVAVELLILEGDNLHKLFPNVCIHVFEKNIGGKHLFVVLSALVMLPTTWLSSLSLLSYVSASGVLASVILICSVFSIGAFENVGFKGRGVLWRWNGLPKAISLYTFCYCGHSVFPTLFTSMKDKRQFRKVLLMSFTLSTVSYEAMAIIGYSMYGENLKSQVTLNLPTRSIGSKVAIYTTVINPITKYAIIVTPIANALEDMLSPRINRLTSLIIRTALVISTVIVALVIPFFGSIMAFCGAFLGISASILFPCLCYLKIKKASRKIGTELIFIVIILVLGFLVAIMGTYLSVGDILENARAK